MATCEGRKDAEKSGGNVCGDQDSVIPPVYQRTCNEFLHPKEEKLGKEGSEICLRFNLRSV